MALNYLDGKTLDDCDTDGHALIVAGYGELRADLLITDYEDLRFLVIFANEYGRDLQSVFNRRGFDYLTCNCNISNETLRDFLNSKSEYLELWGFIVRNEISWIEISFPEKS
ncbi:hypothetical protein [Enterobacter ludwigii]|uniref:hypothetical protein n=1 Tax=Enterobacter ludwigii TaxID=299767 RepID=UPI003BA253C8